MTKLTLGIISGGQLGSMLATAAKKLKIKTVVFCDDIEAPAQKFSDEFVYGRYDDQNKINEFLDKLIEVNSKLWKIEDDIRLCEKNKNFNQHFIDLARAVYITNDKRSDIKSAINNYFGSTLVEVKSYTNY